MSFGKDLPFRSRFLLPFSRPESKM